MALFDLGLPEISSDSRELLKEIIIDTLTLPTVTEAFAYSEKGLPIKLEIGFKENIEAVNFASKEFSSEPYFKNKAGEDFSFFFRIETLEGTFITEILIDEQHILNEWRAVDRQLLTFSLLSFCCVVIVLFLIFYFMIRGIRNREIRLEQGNQLLQRTNKKLAQAYKKVGLGALSGHLMHSLKTPLTHLQMIAREAEEKREVDVKELQKIHLNIRELVSESYRLSKNLKTKKFLIKSLSANFLIR